MKRMLFLVLLFISNLTADAQVGSCPGYTYPIFITVTNATGCDVIGTMFLVDRMTCLGTTATQVTFVMSAGGSIAGIPVPTSYSAYNPARYAIMVQFSWSSSGCDEFQTNGGIQVDGLAGGSNCWSCGPYAPTGISALPMPKCDACNPSGTAHVEWDASGNIQVVP